MRAAESQRRLHTVAVSLWRISADCLASSRSKVRPQWDPKSFDGFELDAAGAAYGLKASIQRSRSRPFKRPSSEFTREDRSP